MGRPAKAVGTMARHNTKKEIESRLAAENALKGHSNKIKPPSYISKNQKKIFSNIVQELLTSNILCNLDIYVLTSCSIAIDRLQEIEILINDNFNNIYNKDIMSAKEKYTKDLYRCMSELSLSPASRAKIANINTQVQTVKDDEVLKALSGDT